MKVLLFVDQLFLGGAGRVASLLVQGLDKLGYNVTVVTDKKMGIKYDLPSDTNVLQIYRCKSTNIFDKIINLLKRLVYTRKLVKKENPNVIITFLPHIFFDIKLATLGLGIPIIASDHTSMSRDLGVWVNFLRHYFYSLADAVTILTEKDKRYLGKKLPNKVVVYNPLTFIPISNICERNNNILCAGRINQWDVKGFDRMIEIFGKLSKKYHGWTLDIAGYGSDNSFRLLKELAKKHKIENSVRFLGQVDDMQTLYKNSMIFALPSRVEGFPMVLIEAMSQGCACISFEMQGAVKEIINDELDGIIVKDNNIDEFINKLDSIMQDSEKRNKLSLNAINNVSRFSMNNFIDNWNIIIKKCGKI